MCDEDTVQESQQYLQHSSNLSRRQFNRLTMAAAITLLLPQAANALDVKENDVRITTPDGTADCFFVHPAKGKYPGVIIWPDVLGLRPAFRLMARRLAESGYAVLAVNPYYRNASSPVIPLNASFQDQATRDIVLPMARSLSSATTVKDAKAFVNFLDSHAAVNKQRKIGTTGYCMGGPFTMYTAAALPERIGAGASFHGGRLVTDKADSPHLLVPKMQADFLFAIAENDDQRQPEAKNILSSAYTNAGLKAEVEVYQGAMHGWCPPDSRVYHQQQAQHAWTRLLALFDSTLV
ncbi:MAG: dienelactone hydrolase family protein [Pseudomonadales bacterium]|nr:dienelactone hydrolase family protein [Pseudomonadales bacterium]